jgi:DNA-formamidopyrimidine glycosylase
MPEMPEVESLRRYLGERLVGLQIERADLLAFSALKTFDPPLDSLVGREVVATVREGKYIGFETAGDGANTFLVLHLARGGWIRWQDEMKPTKAKPGAKGPMALRMTFTGGCGFFVTEAGTEKRLAVWVVRSLHDIENVATLGPDPLTIEPAELAQILRAHSGQVKKVLTEQRVVAGVGNAYSDEALHVARLSPFRQANKLTEEESLRLASAVVQVLRDAVIRSKDVPAGELKSEKKSGMRVHGRTGEQCPECGDVVREVSFATKSLQYCATCQTDGKPLADRRMSRLLK